MVARVLDRGRELGEEVLRVPQRVHDADAFDELAVPGLHSLDEHRDPATLETSMLVGVVIGEGVTSEMVPDDMKQRVVAA
ncbi:MAG: hypothetical protein ACLGIW_14760, partial [Gammaproteobacteria bacterium]